MCGSINQYLANRHFADCAYIRGKDMQSISTVPGTSPTTTTKQALPNKGNKRAHKKCGGNSVWRRVCGTSIDGFWLVMGVPSQRCNVEAQVRLPHCLGRCLVLVGSLGSCGGDSTGEERKRK